MAASTPLPSLQQFVDDELVRAPLLFDQLVHATVDRAHRQMPALSPLQRSTVSDMVQALQRDRERLSEYFVRALRNQVLGELRGATQPLPVASAPGELALVGEEEVAADVALSHTIEAIRSIAEFELRELQTYTSALSGDMDVARDHNPFRPETFAQALWDAAQALALPRGYQVAFVRQAGEPLAHLLRKAYAAASGRLEAQGVEPAAYRTLILPGGARRSRPYETTYAPDLHRIRDAMPTPLEPPPAAAAQLGTAADERTHWTVVAREAADHGTRQAVELVSRLFDAMAADPRVPRDAGQLIMRLQGSALRLTLLDGSLLEQVDHPLWQFINRFCFEAEMTPDGADPERQRLLRHVRATIEQLSSETAQRPGLYRWALDGLHSFLQKRLARRLAGAASQVGALQKLEDKLCSGRTQPSTLHGMLDVPQLDTVPAELMDQAQLRAPPQPSDAEQWLERLAPGNWVRMFLQGRWVHAQLLWPGERHEIWLFGDGASDATWAVRKGALLTMFEERLMKTLKQRSIVGSAAAKVHEQVASDAAA